MVNKVNDITDDDIMNPVNNPNVKGKEIKMVERAVWLTIYKRIREHKELQIIRFKINELRHEEYKILEDIKTKTFKEYNYKVNMEDSL